MKEMCKIGMIAVIIGASAIAVKKAFQCGFQTASDIHVGITNASLGVAGDTIEKYNSLLDDYENLESNYYKLLDE